MVVPCVWQSYLLPLASGMSSRAAFVAATCKTRTGAVAKAQGYIGWLVSLRTVRQTDLLLAVACYPSPHENPQVGSSPVLLSNEDTKSQGSGSRPQSK